MQVHTVQSSLWHVELCVWCARHVGTLPLLDAYSRRLIHASSDHQEEEEAGNQGESFLYLAKETQSPCLAKKQIGQVWEQKILFDWHMGLWVAGLRSGNHIPKGYNRKT